MGWQDQGNDEPLERRFGLSTRLRHEGRMPPDRAPLRAVRASRVGRRSTQLRAPLRVQRHLRQALVHPEDARQGVGRLSDEEYGLNNGITQDGSGNGW